ncbi:hypothetical protein BASA50_005922 [Batrachochytrium salamandrivorans]|uniref:Uncharacterized protein n=1 Tax=Batrachochytrium salamandrivorans TaxID=1357716 RepID=A0ABQ8FBA3_9FUNG|nr:hypothetical protein BASA50_005922 [Batrachochytrium salamandrivorans]
MTAIAVVLASALVSALVVVLLVVVDASAITVTITIAITSIITAFYCFHHALDRHVLPSPPLYRDSLSGTHHRLYLATTVHSRYYPVLNSFRYALFYGGFDLDALEAIDGGCPGLPSWLFGHNHSALFSIWDGDYLTPSSTIGTTDPTQHASIRQSLISILQTFGYTQSDIGRTVLLTTPRFLGHAFNPLNIYYIYSSPATIHQKEDLLLVVLEVNNTFKERHIYLCNEHTRMEKTLPGYTASYSVSRSFHVSPFNNRTGVYEAHVLDIASGKLDVLLNIKDYIDTSVHQRPTNTSELMGSNDDKTCISDSAIIPSRGIHLMAHLYGHAHPMTTFTLIYVIFALPLSTFLTIPRIMYEALKLALRHGLCVYQRPTPVVGQLEKAAQTIVRKRPDAFQQACLQVVLDYFTVQCGLSQKVIKIVYPDGSSQHLGPYDSSSASSDPHTTLYIDSYNGPIKLILNASDPLIGLFLAFTSGDFFCSSVDLSIILDLMMVQPCTWHESKLHTSLADLIGHLSNGLETLADTTKAVTQHPRNSIVLETSPRQIPINESKHARQLKVGKYLYTLEMAWFKMTTTFVDNGEPWLLPIRARAHLSSFQPTVNSTPCLYVRNLSDSMDVNTRERIRAHWFLKCCISTN